MLQRFVSGQRESRCRQSVAPICSDLNVSRDGRWSPASSDAGGLLLGATDRAIGLIDRFAQCFSDARSEELVEHTVTTLIGQRVFGIALGYEDLVESRRFAPRPDPL